MMDANTERINEIMNMMNQNQEKTKKDLDDIRKDTNRIEEELSRAQQDMEKKLKTTANSAENETEPNRSLDGIECEPKSKEEAAHQAKADYQFDENEIYTTLIDPTTRTKKEPENFAHAAITFYKSGVYKNVNRPICDVFCIGKRTTLNWLKRKL